MITVIGGVKIKVEVKMKLPEAPGQDNWAEQLSEEPAQEDAFEAMQARMRAEHDKFWQGEGRQDSQGLMGQLSVIDGNHDEISVKSCGCAFNVARHLADMGNDVALITAVGTDPLGLAALAEMKEHGIDTSLVSRIDGQTPVLFEIKNFAGEIEFARANEALFSEINQELIDSASDVISGSDAIMIDGSVPAETLLYVAQKYGKDIRIFFDPASRAGGDLVSGDSEESLCIMKNLHCVMPGRVEAEKMAGLVILGPDKLREAVDQFVERGVDRAFITIKAGGVFYKEAGDEAGRALRPERTLSFADTSGAGDVVSAAIIHETLKGTDMDGTAKAAMDAAAEFLAGLSDERPY
ncbi:MAG: PfkB family carbohydrate kinase [Bacillota bacterium]|nr:PfkB family carbohydrate kinase [Bacillota bacterium]